MKKEKETIKLVKDVVDSEVEKTQNLRELDKMIDKYSEDDPEIRKLITNAAGQFSSNPRDVKRFMNLLRFYYFILLSRKTRKLSNPSPEHLTRWIILSLKWPELVRWLQGSLGELEYSMNYELASGEPTTLTGYRLMELESLGGKCKNHSCQEKR